MGLDAYLYQFKDLDTDAIVKLSRFSDEPWASESFQRWCLLSQVEKEAHGPFPSPEECETYLAKLLAKAKELHLPDYVAGDPDFGGTRVCFPSQKYPGHHVGDWDPHLGGVKGLLLRFTNRDLYYVFPEATGDPHFFLPDWGGARERLTGLFLELQKIDSKQFAEADYTESGFEAEMSFIGLMIETLDHVLAQDNPRQFLLYWST